MDKTAADLICEIERIAQLTREVTAASDEDDYTAGCSDTLEWLIQYLTSGDTGRAEALAFFGATDLDIEDDT